MDEGGALGSRAWKGVQLPHRFRELLHDLLQQASRGLGRHGFLGAACRSLLEFSACDALELRLAERGGSLRCRAKWAVGEPPAVRFQALSIEEIPPVETGGDSVTERIWRAMLDGRLSTAPTSSTRAGSLWTGDTACPVVLRDLDDRSGVSRSIVIGGEMASIVYLPVPVEGSRQGVLYLGSRRRDFFTRENILFYEAAAETLGVALAHQGTQWALRERVKELTCLYGIARLTQNPSVPEDELMRRAVDLLPPGWQYPEIACARIELDGRTYRSRGFQEGSLRQRAALVVEGEQRGWVEVLYTEERPAMDEGPFLKEERTLIEAVAEMVGMFVARRRSRWALGERIKELTCLFGIAKVAQRPGVSEEDLLQDIVDLLPPAWQHPETTSARIMLDGRTHATGGFQTGTQFQSAAIVVGGRARGTVEVFYTKEMPAADEGPFLKEERSLIDEVARQVGLIIEQREAERERSRLQDQLRHADRLATIGQMAAGAAHELNEPLGSVLGFAELLRNAPSLPPQAEEDAGKIIQAALHAREVVRKLLLFSRQVPALKSVVSLNALVQEGLYFLESRCVREGIHLVRNLAPDLPDIAADRQQIHQVLVNLVVNAIQAMPAGGTLTITTRLEGGQVLLSVEDSGTGMTEEVVKKVFVPFFTTKEVGQGTGLGLSVVHGIVASHGGSVDVRSEVGKGSRFEVRLPVDSPDLEEEVV